MRSLLRDGSAFLSSISFQESQSFCAERKKRSSLLLLTSASRPATLGRLEPTTA